MEDLTFGEQVKIILGRKGMTIKQLAELIEEKTGKKMSRQNLTQRLGRDNFQEQDMRMIADILECPFRLSIMSVDVQAQRGTAALERAAAMRTDAVERRKDHIPEQGTAEAVQQEETAPGERDMTIGELYDMHRELTELEEIAKAGEPVEEIRKELEKPKRESLLRGGLILRKKQDKNTDELPVQKEEEAVVQDADFEPVIPQDDAEEDAAAGDVNPYTGREYQSNSVRMHPTRIGYVQVYDRTIHKWTDMTEWAFLGLQERKKALLGKAYEPPIYLD